MAEKIIDIMNLNGSKEQYLDFNCFRPGQDVRYSINDNKLRSIGWKPVADFDRELVKVVEYYTKTFVW